MPACPFDLAALDASWTAIRNDIENSIAQRQAHGANMAALFGHGESVGGSCLLKWEPANSDTALETFRDIGHTFARAVERCFLADGVSADLSLSRIVDEYAEVKRPDRWNYEEHQERRCEKARELTFAALWQKFIDAYPQDVVDGVAIEQSASVMRHHFRELYSHRPQPVRRVRDRSILTQHIYGTMRTPWTLDWSTRENLHKVMGAVASALHAAGETDAASELRDAGAVLLHRLHQPNYRYASRERHTVTEDLDLIFFKEHLEYHCAPRLADAIKVTLARVEASREAA